MLSDLPVPTDPRVLVDYRNADDAGVFVVGDMALVQTVDFFTPIVDDPFAYGRIAGANAVSDVYAMGGRPITALAIAAFPARDFPSTIVKAIFAGGMSALQECGVALLGGHTVQDSEVKFGYAVTGLVSPGGVWTNGRARAGDVLILTKPIGTGIIATAAKFSRTDAATLDAAVASMQRTNRAAAEALLSGPGAVHGCTDVTGFGLAGHACEMATASGVALLGGHTVQDTEVKFGYAVTGLVSPGAIWTNGGARAGDALVLTKAIGTGVIATAGVAAAVVGEVAAHEAGDVRVQLR